MLSHEKKYAIAAFLFLAFLVSILFVDEWIRSRRSIAQSTNVQHTQEQVVGTAEQHIATTAADDGIFRKGIVKRQAQLTPQTAFAELQAHVPAAAIGADQAVTSAELPADVREKLPDSPGYVCLSEAQTKAIASDQLSCDADRHSLAARESDVTDLKTEIAARTAEAQTWEKTAKGGSKWQRFGRVLKYTACAGGGAGLGALVTKGQSTGAAIGGAGGVVACSLF